MAYISRLILLALILLLAACGAASTGGASVPTQSAATATPAPSTADMPKPAARTAARVRRADVREERDVIRGDIETSGVGEQRDATRCASSRRMGRSLVTRAHINPKMGHLRRTLVINRETRCSTTKTAPSQHYRP